MSRKKELEAELELAVNAITEWSFAKLAKYSDEDLEQESHLLGIDLVHDACHTLRGRLPKTKKITLKSMKDSWENK